jgi:predicted small metal-binding protein
MAKYTLLCKDLGYDCDFKVTSKYVDDIVPKILEHLKVSHSVDKPDEDLKDRIIKSVNKSIFK